MTGGKLTTYRKMAEDTVDVAVGVLGRGAALPHQEPPAPRRPDGRRAAPRAGGAGANVRPDPAHPEASRAAHLAGRFGTEAPAVLAMADGRPELLEPLVDGLPYLAVEALWAVRREMAGTSPTCSTAAPSRPTGTPGRRPTPPPGSPPSSDPSWAGTTGASTPRPSAYAARLRADLARAGLDPGPAGRTGEAGAGRDARAPATASVEP